MVSQKCTVFIGPPCIYVRTFNPCSCFVQIDLQFDNFAEAVWQWVVIHEWKAVITEWVIACSTEQWSGWVSGGTWWSAAETGFTAGWCRRSESVLNQSHLTDALWSFITPTGAILFLWPHCILCSRWKTDQNRSTRFRPKTKLGPKMSFYFRPNPKRNLATIFGWKRKSLFSVILLLYFVNI